MLGSGEERLFCGFVQHMFLLLGFVLHYHSPTAVVTLLVLEVVCNAAEP